MVGTLLFINLYMFGLNLSLWFKSLSTTTQMKAIQRYFSVVLYILQQQQQQQLLFNPYT